MVFSVLVTINFTVSACLYDIEFVRSDDPGHALDVYKERVPNAYDCVWEPYAEASGPRRGETSAFLPK